MPTTWTQALETYSYPVKLAEYNRASEFPGFFKQSVGGDRASTIEFEDYFRANYGRSVEPYFEVVFWKLYSQPLRRQGATDRIVNHVLEDGITAYQLRRAVDSFVRRPTKANLSVFRGLLGIQVDVLAVALTFPALVDPLRYPMIDTRTARWITENYALHSRNWRNDLTPFGTRYTSLRYDDFRNYLNWARWCRETAHMLTHSTNAEWRARDVEMAVFTAAREELRLNPLP